MEGEGGTCEKVIKEKTRLRMNGLSVLFGFTRVGFVFNQLP